MPLNLANIKNDKRTIKADTLWGECEVTYKPSALTPAVEDKIREAESNQQNCEVFVSIVTAWDVMDGDKPYPLTVEALMDFPSALFSAILQACREDMAPKARSGRR